MLGCRELRILPRFRRNKKPNTIYRGWKLAKNEVLFVSIDGGAASRANLIGH